MMHIEIREVAAADTYALRHRVLRPHLPLESVHYPEDLTLESIHVAALLDGQIVGIASVYCQAEASLTDPHAWRLRGMATAPEVRGQGFGGLVLEQTMKLVADRKGHRIWCNARTTASGFYLRYGFVTVGEAYDMPGIGPHYFMKKSLETQP